MAQVVINGSELGTALSQLLTCADIEPGSTPSYQTCKTIYSYHPLGKKLTDTPILMAQSQPRTITIPKGPEDRLKEAFETEWRAIGADSHIYNLGRLARIYGIASVALLAANKPTNTAVDFEELYETAIGFNVLDPLNTSGSLVLNQNPNDIAFQKVRSIAVAGQAYHRSRTCTLLNEDPLYIEYTSSAFGYVGRSVYQRPLYPLKSFIRSMITDDMVLVKSGVLVAMLKAAGSIIDNAMQTMFGLKRQILKEAQTNNVISIDKEEKIESLNLQNIDGAFKGAREDVLENIASGADMPALIIKSETFAQGFGEGTEDAKYVAQFINGIREWLNPAYGYFDKIVQYRAWNPQFYKTIQEEFSEYKKIKYEQAFYEWRNSFTAVWPNLLEEPDSEKIQVDDVKLKAVIAMVEVMGPSLPQDQKAKLLMWAADNFNNLKLLFSTPMELDWDAIAQYEPPQPEQQEKAPPAFSARDSLNEAVARLADRRPKQLTAA